MSGVKFNFVLIFVCVQDVCLQTLSVVDLFTCDFESGTCGVVPDPSADFYWTRWEGLAPILYTGPISGQGSSLYYYLIECAPPEQYGDQARFTTQDLNYVGDICVDFYYEAYGATVNELNVYTEIGGVYGQNHTVIWQIVGQQGNTWIQVLLNVKATILNFRIGWHGICGSNELSSIAVDTIKIFTGKCPTLTVDLPFNCDFETVDLCNMTQADTGSFMWIRVSGSEEASIISGITGPTGAESGSYYMLLNASAGLPGYIAILETPPIAYNGSACLVFYYFMFGTDPSVLQVFTEYVGTNSPWLALQTSEDQTTWLKHSITVNLNNYTDQAGFIGLRGDGPNGYIAIDNMLISPNNCPGDDISITAELPWECTFEEGLCDMTAWSSSNISWSRTIGPAATTDTGPRYADQGFYYIYVDESAAGEEEGERAYIETPAIEYSGEICIQFDYSMYGTGMGTLAVYTSNQGETLPVFSIHSNQGDQWLNAAIDATIDYDEKVVFVGYRGSTDLSDFGLDDIRLTASSYFPPPLAVNETSLPQFPVMSCELQGPGKTNSSCYCVQDPLANFMWSRTSGLTPSGALSTRIIDNISYPVTGPEGARVGDYYIFIDASNRYPGDVARLLCNGSNFDIGTGLVCIHLYYCLNGFHSGLLRVFIRQGDAAPDFIWTVSGDKGSEWFSLALDLNLTPFSQVGIEATTTGGFSGDTALDNITITPGLCHAYMWQCNFELVDGSSTLCNTHSDVGTNFNWWLWNGPSPSQETGPSSAENGAYYILMDASYPRIQGEVAEILLPSLLYVGAVCLEYYYHMWGFHMGTLEVYVMSAGTGADTTLWSLSGNQDDVWIENRLTVNLLLLDNRVCKYAHCKPGATRYSAAELIGFRGIRGSAFSSYIGIDNVRVTQHQCT